MTNDEKLVARLMKAAGALADLYPKKFVVESEMLIAAASRIRTLSQNSDQGSELPSIEADSMAHLLRGVPTVLQEDRATLEDAASLILKLDAAKDRCAEWAASFAKKCVEVEKLSSLLRQWCALDAGSWHAERHAHEKSRLHKDTYAALGE